MKLSKEIVAGRSLGGIALGASVDIVIASLGDRRVLDLCNGVASIDGGIILIGYGEDGLIYDAHLHDAAGWSFIPYHGRYAHLSERRNRISSATMYANQGP